MDTPRIKIDHALGQWYPNEISDFEWVHNHRPELLEKYGECVLLVYEQKVVGKGQTLREAMENAEQNLSAEVELITPVIELLAQRQPFLSWHIKVDNQQT
jgi:hypothetical protein